MVLLYNSLFFTRIFWKSPTYCLINWKSKPEVKRTENYFCTSWIGSDAKHYAAPCRKSYRKKQGRNLGLQVMNPMTLKLVFSKTFSSILIYLLLICTKRFFIFLSFLALNISWKANLFRYFQVQILPIRNANKCDTCMRLLNMIFQIRGTDQRTPILIQQRQLFYITLKDFIG